MKIFSANGSLLRRKRFWIVLYLLLLLCSHTVQYFSSADINSNNNIQFSFVKESGHGAERSKDIRLAYRQIGNPDQFPTLVLLHGSPGSSNDFNSLADALEDQFHIIIVDLPGFGASQRDITDYSIAAHADYVSQLLDQLKLKNVHLLSFSMGGGVALEMVAKDAGKYSSLSMVSSIGVQELELLGSYELNHLIHAAQLGGIWFLENIIPSFGIADAIMLNKSFARNFYDSDQRPLRAILDSLQLPVQIIHGREDPLVPFAVAREHQRIVAHSELHALDASHFLLWTQTSTLVELISSFVERTENGEATSRASASAQRIAAAELNYEDLHSPQAEGLTLYVLLLLIVLGTFLTEDLTCIATGLLIAQGRLSWEQGFFAAFCGIFFGDLLLYALGRFLGRNTLGSAPWKWWIKEKSIRRAAEWFDRRGMIVIFLSRFIPGTRLPTYVAAGIVKARFWLFSLYFFIAVAVWTPLLVGFSAVLGQEAFDRLEHFRKDSIIFFLLVVLVAFVLMQIFIPLATMRGRRILVGKLNRIRHWEFWPIAVLYFPICFHILGLAMRYRSLRVCTLVNPSIAGGGLCGESKVEILAQFEDGQAQEVARYIALPFSAGQNRLELSDTFMKENAFDFPIVLKPDIGERGRGVEIVRSRVSLEALLNSREEDLILQEWLAGEEFGVFYMRDPDSNKGRIVSIVSKRMPSLVGDGVHSLEKLILLDSRAVALAERYFDANEDRLQWIPSKGEKIQLVELGTHSGGCIFEDAQHLQSDALLASFDRLVDKSRAIHFGRFDIRVESNKALVEGRSWKVMEFNGLSSESAHIYDRKHSIFYAWKILSKQWGEAFRIGNLNRRNGHPLPSWPFLIDLYSRGNF